MIRPSAALCSISFRSAIGLAIFHFALPLFAGGQFAITIVDRDTNQPLYCRMHLKNGQGKPVKPPKVPYWHDHFVVPGKIVLKLPKGNYTFEIECGLEYLTRSGNFTINEFADDAQTIDLKRFVDMSKEGWWSGDLFVRRPEKDLQDLMRADDLHVVPAIAWWNAEKESLKPATPKQPLLTFDTNRALNLFGGGDSRAGGTVLLFNLPTALDGTPSSGVILADSTPEYPSSLQVIHRAKKASPQVFADAAEAYAWDLPLWVAAGKLDSIELANGHLCRESMIDNEGTGRPRDRKLYADIHGNARWNEDIYFRLLNCGLRIAPSAGSGSGVSPNPIGYNRVYVQMESQFSYEKWFEGLKAGRVLVTNGPLIRPTVEGEPPGHVFQYPAGETHEFEIALTMSTREKIRYLEIIRNGEVEHHVSLDEFVDKKGQLPKLLFKESGWFMVRAVTDAVKTYRFGITGPYYVEIGEKPRISRAAAKFFVDWENERLGRIKLEGAQLDEVQALHRRGLEFWKDILSKANAE